MSVAEVEETVAPVADELTEDEIKQRMTELQAQMAAITQTAAAKGIKLPSASSRGGGSTPSVTVQRLISAANADAKAQHAHDAAEARLVVTSANFAEARTAYLQSQGMTDLPADLVQRIEASRAKTVENLETAREKIRAKLSGRNTKESVPAPAPEPQDNFASEADASADDEPQDEAAE